MYWQSEELSRLGEEVIQKEKSLAWIKEAGVKICFLYSDKEKKKGGRVVLGDCRLVREPWSVFCPYDFLITVYEPNTAGLDEQRIHILLFHELLHVGISEKDDEPVYRTNPHDVEDFREIIERYGMDWPEVVMQCGEGEVREVAETGEPAPD